MYFITWDSMRYYCNNRGYLILELGGMDYNRFPSPNFFKTYDEALDFFNKCNEFGYPLYNFRIIDNSGNIIRYLSR